MPLGTPVEQRGEGAADTMLPFADPHAPFTAVAIILATVRLGTAGTAGEASTKGESAIIGASALAT